MGLLIHELSELVGLHPTTLRVLERKGLVIPARDRNGWRRYEHSAVNKIRELYANGHAPRKREAVAK